MFIQWSTGIEPLCRSMAMLPPGLSREEAMRVLAELREMDQCLRDLREGLFDLLERASPNAGGSNGSGRAAQAR